MTLEELGWDEAFAAALTEAVDAAVGLDGRSAGTTENHGRRTAQAGKTSVATQPNTFNGALAPVPAKA
jgi:hypothetical protein